MALLDKLKSLLGLDDGRSGSDRQGTDETGVTVEREQGASGEDAPPASPAPGSEDATPEPAAESEPDAGTEPDREPEPDVDPEVESPGTESTVDELEGRGATDEPETEPASGPAADADSEPLETVDPEPEPEADSGSEPEPEPEPEIGDESGADAGSEAADDPVREIKGIGPSYATKLSEAGVESAGDLAAADAGELSEETGLSKKRIQGWIERAQAR